MESPACSITARFRVKSILSTMPTLFDRLKCPELHLALRAFLGRREHEPLLPEERREFRLVFGVHDPALECAADILGFVRELRHRK